MDHFDGNCKVYVVNERDDYYIGTVRQILKSRSWFRPLQVAIAEMVYEMMGEEWLDDESVSFAIEIRK